MNPKRSFTGEVLVILVFIALLLSLSCKELLASDPITHSIVGGYAGYFLADSAEDAFLVGIASHALLDMLPHYSFPEVKKNLFYLGVFTFFASLKLYQNLDEDERVLWGALGGVLPDAERVLVLKGLITQEQMIFPTHTGFFPSGPHLPDFEGLGFSLRGGGRVGIQFCLSFP